MAFYAQCWSLRGSADLVLLLPMTSNAMVASWFTACPPIVMMDWAHLVSSDKTIYLLSDTLNLPQKATLKWNFHHSDFASIQNSKTFVSWSIAVVVWCSMANSTTGKDSEKSGTFITHKSFSRLEKKRPITEPNIPSTGKAKYIMTAVSTSTNLHCQSFHRLQLVSMVG